MSRVLLVDADATCRQQVARALVADGHEVFQATGVEQAVAWATTQVVDLVVSDLQPAGTDAPTLKRLVDRGLAPHPVPFIYLSGAPSDQAAALADLAEEPALLLLRKPAEIHLLCWLVRSVGANLAQLKGSFADESFPRLLEHIANNQDSGVLRAYRDTTLKKVVFLQGSVVACYSNDPTELIGQWCIQHGLIDEGELREALQLHSESGEPLLGILQTLQKVTDEQALELLTAKVREGVLNLFSWTDGNWSYDRGRSELRFVLAEGLAVAPLRAEGLKRARGLPASQAAQPVVSGGTRLADPPLRGHHPAPRADGALVATSRPPAVEQSQTVRLEVPVSQLLDDNVPAHEAFVLSRLAAGAMPVSHLVADCPLPEEQTLMILDGYVRRGLVGVSEGEDGKPPATA